MTRSGGASLSFAAGRADQRWFPTEAERDTIGCRTGVKVSDEELAAIPLDRRDLHGDLKYTIKRTVAV